MCFEAFWREANPQTFGSLVVDSFASHRAVSCRCQWLVIAGQHPCLHHLHGKAVLWFLQCFPSDMPMPSCPLHLPSWSLDNVLYKYRGLGVEHGGTASPSGCWVTDSGCKNFGQGRAVAKACCCELLPNFSSSSKMLGAHHHALKTGYITLWYLTSPDSHWPSTNWCHSHIQSRPSGCGIGHPPTLYLCAMHSTD